MCNSDSTNCLISETLNGYISVNDRCYQIIWQAIDLNASITIKVKNLSQQTMKLDIHKNKKISVYITPNEEQIITASNVHSITVRCTNTNSEQTCMGSYQLILHFPVNFNECKKPYNNKCEATGWHTIK